ncbi:zeta toxin family protein [Pseudomonas sp. YuFO20]|uniref:zeta toxin family protein n=1 Tax=Pseudomonas sp. YuFO20 TaxID=3095362 RepID=UPI002B2417BB|nr:zeta toxin family protein [Pseudomonas sp. YuFO20]MEB2514584.1 zeta toxin family protein [Pseudomonas sp. YuFO20]
MTEEELAIEARAIAFAKEHRTRIARELACVQTYPGEDHPVSIFMAGSPGAGKTEVSKALIGGMDGMGSKALRIDPDDLRGFFPEYRGNNSRLFQRGVNTIVERLHDLVLSQRQSFLLDGTMSNAEVAKRNVERSLRRNRFVGIVYVYQQPLLAWEFVKARELTEGRSIPKAEFIRQLFAAKEAVLELKKTFRLQIRVDVIIKNTDGTHQSVELNADVAKIDALVTTVYSPEQLDQILTEA